MWRQVDFAWRLGTLCLAFVAGIAVQLQWREPPGPWLAAAAFGSSFVAVVAGWRRRSGLAWVCAALLLGFALATARAQLRLAQELPAALEGEDVVVEGVIASLPQVGGNGLRFHFDIASAWWREQPVQVPGRVALGWYAGFGEDPAGAGPADGLRAGQAWRWTVRMRRPHAGRNPHGYDQELAHFEQGVRATGSVRPRARVTPRLLGESPFYPVERARQHVRDAIFASVPDRRAAGVLAALAIGDQSAIDHADWQVFRDTGVAHLMSISGLHVTMFAWLAGALLRRLWSRSRRLCLGCPAPAAARVGGLAAASAYAVFAGWGVPAQRTVWMLAVVTLLSLRSGHWPWLLVLAVAAVVVSALDPWALLQAGFWLSFVAVGLLMVSGSGAPVPAESPARGEAPGRWQRMRPQLVATLRAQAVAAIGLTPLSLVFFQQVSVVGFAANLLAIPIVTLVITPLALLGMAAAPLWAAGAWCVQLASAALAEAGRWPWAVGVVPVAPGWAQASGLAAAAVAVMPLPWRLRLLAVPLVLPLLLPPVAHPPQGRFDVVAVDVGQGTAVLVRTRRHLLVYDTGPRYSPDATAGERVLLPLLHARGETRIHRLVVSHRDTDHTGGAQALLAALPVDELMSSLEPGHALLGQAAADARCDAGQSWTWDGVRFDVLFPFAGDHARPLKPNARSCVLRVHGEQGTVLLTGDIERDQEARLVASGVSLDADVLLVPHHGSRTSSSAAFLDAVRARVGIVQAGHRNRFGHPAAEVVRRLEDRGATVRSTAACGAWTWHGTTPLAEAVCERERSMRYWHHAGDTGPGVSLQ